jgi:hypothetical protein
VPQVRASVGTLAAGAAQHLLTPRMGEVHSSEECPMSAFLECAWAVRWWILAALAVSCAVFAYEEWRNAQ